MKYDKTKDTFTRTRKKMVEEQIIGRGITNPLVINAMTNVPRHTFVTEALHSKAYSDFALPIKADQTISQPYIVSLMTEALDVSQDDTVLEIGTGSGYQAAVLGEIVDRVFTIERIRELYSGARKILEELDYHNVIVKLGDGTLGWSDEAPFDAIIVTAGCPFDKEKLIDGECPKPLYDQLKVGGRIVIPVGSEQMQRLLRFTKTETGLKREDLGGCMFVKLIGKYGWEKDAV